MEQQGTAAIGLFVSLCRARRAVLAACFAPDTRQEGGGDHVEGQVVTTLGSLSGLVLLPRQSCGWNQLWTRRTHQNRIANSANASSGVIVFGS